MGYDLLSEVEVYTEIHTEQLSKGHTCILIHPPVLLTTIPSLKAKGYTFSEFREMCLLSNK